MDVDFLAELKATPLSPARRLFVIQQMLDQFPSQSDSLLQKRLRQLLTLDRRTLRREASLRHIDAPGLTSGDQLEQDRQSRAHREFTELIAELVSSLSPPVSYRVLEPLRRQLERLRSFDAIDTAPAPRAHASL